MHEYNRIVLLLQHFNFLLTKRTYFCSERIENNNIFENTNHFETDNIDKIWWSLVSICVYRILVRFREIVPE